MTTPSKSPGVPAEGAPVAGDEVERITLVMQDMAQAMLSAKDGLSMVGRSAYWTDAEIVANAREQLTWGLERWATTRAEGAVDG